MINTTTQHATTDTSNVMENAMTHKQVFRQVVHNAVDYCCLLYFSHSYVVKQGPDLQEKILGQT